MNVPVVQRNEVERHYNLIQSSNIYSREGKRKPSYYMNRFTKDSNYVEIYNRLGNCISLVKNLVCRLTNSVNWKYDTDKSRSLTEPVK